MDRFILKRVVTKLDGESYTEYKGRTMYVKSASKAHLYPRGHAILSMKTKKDEHKDWRYDYSLVKVFVTLTNEEERLVR